MIEARVRTDRDPPRFAVGRQPDEMMLPDLCCHCRGQLFVPLGIDLCDICAGVPEKHLCGFQAMFFSDLCGERVA